MFVLRSSISVQVSTAIFGINKDEEEKGGGGQISIWRVEKKN